MHLRNKNNSFGFCLFFKEATLTLKRDKTMIVETILNLKIKTNYKRCNTTVQSRIR